MAFPILCRYSSLLLPSVSPSSFFFFFVVVATLPFETTLASAMPAFSFSFERFGNTSSVVRSEILFSGDARITSDSFVELTRPPVTSSGGILYKKPIRFLGRNPGFSTHFSFSGDYLAFLVLSNADDPQRWTDGSEIEPPPSVLRVNFNSLGSSISQNHIQISVSSETYTKSSDPFATSLIMDNGEKLRARIDYDGKLKRLDVILSAYATSRPTNSSVSFPMDLSGLLQREPMFFSLRSMSRSSTNPSCIYSWSFTSNLGTPYQSHSEPLNPETVVEQPQKSPPIHHGRISPWRLGISLVFGAVFGGFVVAVVMLIRAVFVNQQQVAPINDEVHSVEFGCKKIALVGERDAKGVIKEAET